MSTRARLAALERKVGLLAGTADPELPWPLESRARSADAYDALTEHLDEIDLDAVTVLDQHGWPDNGPIEAAIRERQRTHPVTLPDGLTEEELLFAVQWLAAVCIRYLVTRDDPTCCGLADGEDDDEHAGEVAGA